MSLKSTGDILNLSEKRLSVSWCSFFFCIAGIFTHVICKIMDRDTGRLLRESAAPWNSLPLYVDPRNYRDIPYVDRANKIKRASVKSVNSVIAAYVRHATCAKCV